MSSFKVCVSDSFEVETAQATTVTVGEKGIAIAGLKNDGFKDRAAFAGLDGIAIAGDSSHACAGIYGIAIAGTGGVANSLAVGAAIADRNGIAVAGNGGVAFVRDRNGQASAGDNAASAICTHDGISNVGERGFAAAEAGIAMATRHGIASVRAAAACVSVGDGGVAIAWLHPPTSNCSNSENGEETAVAGPVLLGGIKAGEGGLLISFIEGADGKRKPVIGFVGDAEILVQNKLSANSTYKLSQGGQFVLASEERVDGGKK